MKYLKPTFKPFDNQLENAKKLVNRRRALLVDKVGNGKTATVLMAFSFLKEKERIENLLVLTPKNAYEKEVWKNDSKKFTELNAIDLETLCSRVSNSSERLEKYLREYQIIYGKHTHLKKREYFNLCCNIAKTRTIICIDEVHAMRNAKSALSRIYMMLSRKSYALWGLTGTPLSRNLEDTYNIVSLIKPWFLGSFVDFRDRYCKCVERVIGRSAFGLRKVLVIVGAKDEEEFKNKLEPLVVTGKSVTVPTFHYIEYSLNKEEEKYYRRIAHGIDLEENTTEGWLEKILGDAVEVDEHPIKDVEKHSSRFIYLQSAADGILNGDGTQTNENSSKMKEVIKVIKEIVSRGESTFVYFDYYAALEVFERVLRKESLNISIFTSSGKKLVDSSKFNERTVKVRPCVVLCTRAASESESCFFVNNVIFFHIPTVPSTMVQMGGRITRKNTLFPGNLHLWLLKSENIDLYKLITVSVKSYQMELVSDYEANIPEDYKKEATKGDLVQVAKRHLLWENNFK